MDAWIMPASAWPCTNARLLSGTELLLDAVAEVAACTNLLQNLSHWHVVCATGGALRLGDTRVSQGEEQETQMQETTFRAAGLTRAPR